MLFEDLNIPKQKTSEIKKSTMKISVNDPNTMISAIHKSPTAHMIIACVMVSPYIKDAVSKTPFGTLFHPFCSGI